MDINIKNTLQYLIKLYFSHEHKKICDVLKIEHNPDHNNDPINKYKEEDGMVFYNNKNPMIYTRVYVDNETKYILNTLIMVTSNSTNEKDIIDYVINKWLGNIHQTEVLKYNSLSKIDENKSRVQLKISKRTQEDLMKACKSKGIPVKIGFKMSLLNYMNEICIITQ